MTTHNNSPHGPSPYGDQADNLKSISGKVRDPTNSTSYDLKDHKRGRVARIPRRLIEFGYRVVQKFGFKCRNKSEKKFYKRRFKLCPVPTYRRFGRDREIPPYYCSFCELQNDPEPKDE